jgi:hypothetical protein
MPVISRAEPRRKSVLARLGRFQARSLADILLFAIIVTAFYVLSMHQLTATPGQRGTLPSGASAASPVAKAPNLLITAQDRYPRSLRLLQHDALTGAE